MIWLLSIVLALAPVHAKSKKSRSKGKSSAPASSRLTKVGSCNPAAPSEKTVLIVKQWHLAPKTVTKGFKEKYPHERNQTAIYLTLAEGLKRKKLQLVVAEGCEGEITKEFKPSFNGWDYASLHKIAQTKGYEKILTMVPLKIEARFDEDVLTICGDDEKLIQDGLLRLSNLRGWMGFWTRLRETYPDDRGKLYSDAAAELLKVPKTTPTADLLKQINVRAKDELEAFRNSLAARNDAFVKVLQEQKFETAAAVIGGLHAADLREKVEKAGMGCEVLEPPGYQKEYEKLIDDFEKALAQQ